MKTFHKVLLGGVGISLLVGCVGSSTVFAVSPTTVNLGTAGNFVILAKTGVSTTGSTIVLGDVGLSPAAASYITGFSLVLPAASAFSTSALVSGKVYAPGYANPTPVELGLAVLDMQFAYTDAAGRAPDVVELGAGNIGGLTLAPGVYKWGTNVVVPTNVTLSGSANDIWIFQVAQNLTLSSGAKIILAGGAQASNIFWVVAGQTTLGTTSVFNGTILDQTTVVLNTNAQLNGRALAQAAVTLDSNAVTAPTAAVPVTVTPTSTLTTPAGGMITPPAGVLPPPYVAPVTVTPTPTSTASQNTNVALQLQLNALVANLQSLQMQASQQGSNVRTITVSLEEGSMDNNVSILQQFLIMQNKGQSAQSLARVGATGYFGVLTRAALAEFQVKAGISPALGNFGPITRAYLSTH